MKSIIIALLLAVSQTMAAPAMERVDKVFAGQARVTSYASESRLEERGRGTYYNTHDHGQNEGYSGIGSCGGALNDGMWIAAIQDAPWGSPNCWKTIAIKNDETGKCIDGVQVQDRCGSCGYGDVDMTPTVFNALFGGLTRGIGPVSWWYGTCGGASVAAAPAQQECYASDWTQCPATGCCINGFCKPHFDCFGW